MARKVFYSFHYIPDNWRVSQVRNIGSIEDNKPAKDNDWETVKKGGDAAIKKWIDEQLSGRSCTVVLIGQDTAKRKWIDYEIEKSWNNGKGVLGIHIHNLKNAQGEKSKKGSNPFSHIKLEKSGASLDSIVKTYDPPYTDSKEVYDYIASNLESWIEKAIDSRK